MKKEASQKQKQVLQKARLSITFIARNSKGPINKGKSYQISEFILYDTREKCDLCTQNDQAKRQVVITRENASFRSGLNCLEDVSNITSKQLEKAVEDHIGIAIRLSNSYQNKFTDETEMLTHIESMVNDIEQEEEKRIIITELQRMQGLSHFKEREVNWLQEVIDLLALSRFAKNNEDGYDRLIEATFEYPGETAEQIRNGLIKESLKQKQITASQAGKLKRALKKLRELRPTTLFNESIQPWKYPDHSSYIDALRNHYTNQAEQGYIDRKGYIRLQEQYDLIHHDRETPEPEDLLTEVGIPCIFPIYRHAEIRSINFTSPVSLRALENRNRLPINTMQNQFHLSGVDHVAEIRTDNPNKRINNHGKISTPDPHDTKTITYQCLALWRSDRWYPIYSLWYTHGREQLLMFPELASAETETSGN